MLVIRYESKKKLKECVGKRLKYIETSIMGPEYTDNGTFVACNRPHITGFKREFYAQITMKDGLIEKVK